jgi:hypothetical protein
MKKTIFIMTALVVVAVAGAGTYLYLQKPKDMLTDVLPQEPLVFVQLSDVEQNLKKLSSMPLWTGIRDLNYDLLQSKNAEQGKPWQVLKLIKDQISAVTNNPVAKKLFGKEIAFAVYPPDKETALDFSDFTRLNPALMEDLLSGLYLVTRVDPDVQFAEFVARFFDQFGDNITRGEVVYKDETIHTVKVNDLGIKFGLVRLKNIMILGLGEKAARASIDVYKNDRPALSGSQQFTRLKKEFLDPAELTGLVHVKAFRGFLAKQMENFSIQNGEDDKQNPSVQWDTVLAQFSGLETFGISSQIEPIPRIDYHVLFNPSELDDEFADIYTCPAQENKSLPFIPKDVLGYQWSNCFHLDYYWQQIQKEMAKSPESTAQIATVEAQTGFSISKDILPAFGDEIGGYIQDIQVGGLFPIPKLLLFIKIQDRSKAERLLARLKEQPFMMLQQENYNGTALEYLSLPLGQDIQPGYCFIGDYLLVATSSSLLKSSVDVSKNSSMSLLANAAFQEVDYGLTDKNRSIQFIMVEAMIEKLKGVVRWGNQWVTAQDQKAQAFITGSSLPLEEVKATIQNKQRELSKINDQIPTLEDEIWSLETQGQDVSAKQAALKVLQEQRAAKELEIADQEERKAELMGIVQEYHEQTPDPSLRQLYLDEVVAPILDSLKAIKASGFRATVDGDILKSSLILKINN